MDAIWASLTDSGQLVVQVSQTVVTKHKLKFIQQSLFGHSSSLKQLGQRVLESISKVLRSIKLEK